MRNPVSGYKQELYPKGDISQWFAENPDLYAFMGLKGHNGIDIVRAHGTPMYAVEDGTILEVNDDPKGFGKHIRLISDKSTLNAYREWTYGHCSATFVTVGQKVTAGQVVANMGNTGFCVSGATPFWKNNPYAGTHLHLGLRLLTKPRRGGWTYPESNIRIDVIDYRNGFKGAIDPAPYLVGATDATPSASVKELQERQVGLLTKLRDILAKQLRDLMAKK